MTESWSIDGFDGKLQLISADEIQHAFALESQSMHSLLNLHIMCVLNDYSVCLIR